MEGERRYRYLGDRMTDPALRGALCVAVIRPDGKCVSGRSAMLVMFDGEGTPRVVQRRMLRKNLSPSPTSKSTDNG